MREIRFIRFDHSLFIYNIINLIFFLFFFIQSLCSLKINRLNRNAFAKDVVFYFCITYYLNVFLSYDLFINKKLPCVFVYRFFFKIYITCKSNCLDIISK